MDFIGALSMVSVFDYLDFRRFLKDQFSELKENNPTYSFRSFNRQAGIQSSGFLKLVMDGKRNLGDSGIRKIVKGFKLSEEEARYFDVLVKFNQAENNGEKDHFFQQLAKNKKFLSAKPLTAAQYQLFSNWFYVAILELVRIRTKQIKNLDWITQGLYPKVEKKLVKKALKELCQVGLLEAEENGGYLRRDQMMTTEDEVQSLSVANFHSQMSQLAARAVSQEEAQEREFSSLTILTSEEGFQAAKQEIQKFRKKLHSILEHHSRDSKKIVSHINLQLFKLNKTAP